MHLTLSKYDNYRHFGTLNTPLLRGNKMNSVISVPVQLQCHELFAVKETILLCQC